MRHHCRLVVITVAAVAGTASIAACTSTRTVHTAPQTVTVRETATAAAAAATTTVTTQRTVTLTVAPPAPQPTASVGDRVDGTGTRFAAPATHVVKRFGGSDVDCYGLADPGFTAQCELVHTRPGTAVGVVELNDDQERDLVYTVHGSVATLAQRQTRTVLSTAAYGGRYYSSASSRLQLSDLALDNTPKLVFYTPIASSAYVDAFQSIDVVEATGRVTLHRTLDGGVASRAFGGGLEIWTPLGAGVEHEIVQWSSGAWRVTTAEVVGKDAIPSTHDLF